jgi:hypothetical protein
MKVLARRFPLVFTLATVPAETVLFGITGLAREMQYITRGSLILLYEPFSYRATPTVYSMTMMDD